MHYKHSYTDFSKGDIYIAIVCLGSSLIQSVLSDPLHDSKYEDLPVPGCRCARTRVPTVVGHGGTASKKFVLRSVALLFPQSGSHDEKVCSTLSYQLRCLWLTPR